MKEACVDALVCLESIGASDCRIGPHWGVIYLVCSAYDEIGKGLGLQSVPIVG